MSQDEQLSGGTASATAHVPSGRIGGGYWAWLTAAICSEFGSSVMAFAIVWTATGFGGTTAGLVNSAMLLFSTVLLLAGGALGDRYGPRRIMIVCDGSMLFLTGFAAVWFASHDPTIGSLVAVGCMLGIVSAFYDPASGVFPRLFVDDSQLTRVMATTSSALQVARIAGPAAAGVLLAWIGLTWVVALNTLSFLLVFITVLLVVPPRAARRPDTQHTGLRDAWRSLRTAGQHKVLLPLLAAFTVLVAGTSPALALLFPLLARNNGWSAASAGLMEASFMAAALAIGVTVAIRGAMSRPSIALVGAPLLAGLGLLTVAVAPSVWVACIGAAAVGTGLVTFNAHAIPRFLQASPPGAQVRLQALLGLTATVPALVLSGPYGALAQHVSPSWALAAATAWALGSAAIMATTKPWSVPRTDPTPATS